MLKKNDLAKQFELVVQQEIKNYNDSLNFVLSSLRELNQKIEESSQDSLENYAIIHSEQSRLNSEIQVLKEICLKLNNRFETALMDQKVLNEKNAYEMKDITSSFIEKIQIDKKFQDKIDHLREKLYNVESETRSLKINIPKNLDEILCKIRREMTKALDSLIEKPSEAASIFKDVNEKIAIYKIDVDGVLKEIRAYKKDNFILEKKIEHLYTLIERVKKVTE